MPAQGWGWFHLDGAEPHAGKDWTDNGRNRDRRQLKQRERGETRDAPCPPELTALIHAHVGAFGFAVDGRLFRGERNDGELPKGTINRMWRLARARVFVPEILASPLAATPYDLRHAAVSTWLNGECHPADVAAWAGHSVEVLLKIYAKCLDGRYGAAAPAGPDGSRPPHLAGRVVRPISVKGRSGPPTTRHNRRTSRPPYRVPNALVRVGVWAGEGGCAPGRIRTCAPASGGRCSIP